MSLPMPRLGRPSSMYTDARFEADNEPKGFLLPQTGAVVYFSEPALNEVDDARHTTNAENSVGLTSRFVTLTRQTTALLSQPGSADKVDFALKRARRAGRPVWRSVHDVTAPGSVFDVELINLRIGVMPFAYFGCYGEGAHKRGGRVRVFWAQALVPPRRKRSADPARELILLGSLNRLINEPWSSEDESALMIGHGYPSEPSVLSRLVRTELQLEDASVQHHIDSVGKFETLAPGCYARFASAQTARARETMCRDEGFVTHWERRPPLRCARVVAITDDVCDSSEETGAGSTLLARPILIRDLS